MNQLSIHDRIMAASDRESNVRHSGDPQPAVRSGFGLAFWVVLAALLAIALAAGAAIAFLQYSNPFASSGGRAQTVSVPAAPQPALPDSPFLAHAREAGLEKCATVFPILGQMLTDGARFAVQSEWNEKEPDRHPVQALVGLDYQSEQYTGPAAGLVFAAPNGSSCEGTMVRVAPLPASCDSVSGSLPTGSKLIRSLGESSVFDLADNGGQALLLPSGTTCIVVSVARAGAP
ncbi:hypothetical protein [Ciceribacter sp. RN22]|uniref:hypothetical protein n=1 Tax=Ciceribacter sp. RN22 TaxID=2954932 RepID=UPI002092924E|nr:hypothetical protein [Ciceribacter sp. RN22]MCO6181001.1 hypothetical protein [Ciceribacter sp. RN22]